MKRIIYSFLLFISASFANAQVTNVFTVTNNSGTTVLTCNVTQIDLTVSTNVIPPWYFQWMGPSTATTGTHVVLVQPGTYTVAMHDSLNALVGIQTITITANNTPPGATLSPLFQNITCGSLMVNFTSTAIGNVTQSFISPQGGTLVAVTNTANYSTSSPGQYTVVVYDNVNGCESANTFTVTSNNAFPTFSLSSPQNYTLGCATKSVAVVNINNPQGGGGGAATYTVIPFSSPVPSGTLSSVTVYTFATPGAYYAIVRDYVTQCTTQIPFTIISNTLSPTLSLNQFPTVLDCYTTQTTMQASSSSTNATFSWLSPSGPPISQSSLAVNANISAPTATIIGTYTLKVTDSGNACSSQTVITMLKNTFPPNALIGVAGTSVITCTNPSLTLVNQSSTGIPFSVSFPNSQPVVGYQWLSNVQPTATVVSSYVVSQPDTYTLVAKDLNNGCMSTAIRLVGDNRIYPDVAFMNSNPALLPCPGSITLTPIVMSTTMSNYTYSWTAPANATFSALNQSTLVTATPGTYTLTVTNPQNNCSTTTSIGVWACVGIGEPGNDHRFSVFPNPSNGLYEIIFNNDNLGQLIQLFDLTGQCIRQQEIISDKTSLDLSQIANGVYFLRIKGQAERGSVKIIKQ